MAVMIYVAELSGRRPIMEKVDFEQTVDKVFNLSEIPRSPDVCPCYHYLERLALTYDDQVESLGQPYHESFTKKTIILQGYYQSWKYTRSIEAWLRRYFTFKPALKAFAHKFLKSNFPPGWTQAFVRVAIHVRRGNYLEKHFVEFGYTVPNATYFQRAMEYFVRNYGRVQFVVVSEDRDWSRANVVLTNDMSPKQVNVTYAFGNDEGQDMAIMTSCDHVIMSTGTFGWWAGFLAKGSAVYFSDWPRNGTKLSSMFRKEDFFPPAWIPMQ
jgi:galactoside 2-L-fucosyltransferase 1/2